MKTNFILLFLMIFGLYSCSKRPVSLANSVDNTSAQNSSPQEIPQTAEVQIKYENAVYSKNIKTVQLHDAAFELSSPIIALGSSQQLKLSFDDLEGGLKNYHYTAIHCDANWEPSRLNQFEYLDGYMENNITDYQFSFNTLQKYTHYNLFFPNQNMRITKSGNYILKVYLDNNPNNAMITRRFMVAEEQINISAQSKQPSIIDDRNYKQEIDFIIHHQNYEIADPFGDLKIVMMQNDRVDNAIIGLKPVFVKNNELVYDYDRENVFTGGNEFRNFDIKSLRYQSEFIKDVRRDSLTNHVYLTTSEKRTFKRYYSDRDINGKYLVKIQEGRNSEIEADYTWVHFFLAMDNPVSGGEIYILGGLSDWSFKDEFKLKYNFKRFGYEAQIYLKQGYYNYQYVLLEDRQQKGDEAFIEGTHFETENDYTILAYHRSRGTNYDRLIGVKKFKFHRN